MTQTFIIIVKSFIGTGVLTMPRAFYNGGMLFAPMTMLIMGAYSLVSKPLLSEISCHWPHLWDRAPPPGQWVGQN